MGKTLSREEELTQVGRLPFAAACGVTLAGDAHGNVVGCGMTVRQGLASLHQAWGGDSGDQSAESATSLHGRSALRCSWRSLLPALSLGILRQWQSAKRLEASQRRSYACCRSTDGFSPLALFAPLSRTLLWQRLQQLIFVLQDEAEENDDEVEDPPEEAASSWTEAQIREYYASKVLNTCLVTAFSARPS